jgi:hypothetical protein
LRGVDMVTKVKKMYCICYNPGKKTADVKSKLYYIIILYKPTHIRDIVTGQNIYSVICRKEVVPYGLVIVTKPDKKSK